MFFSLKMSRNIKLLITHFKFSYTSIFTNLHKTIFVISGKDIVFMIYAHLGSVIFEWSVCVPIHLENLQLPNPLGHKVYRSDGFGVPEFVTLQQEQLIYIEKLQLRDKFQTAIVLCLRFKTFETWFEVEVSQHKSGIPVVRQRLRVLQILLTHRPQGAYIKYVGGGPEGFKNFLKKFRSLGDPRPKYFMTQ